MGSPKTPWNALMCPCRAPWAAEGMLSRSMALWVATAANRSGLVKAIRSAA